MGAAWRNPHERDMPYVLEMVKEVKALGLETCMTLGMLNASQAERLKDAGLDYYNHNLDTSREYYSHIISTRSFDDRLNTLDHVRQAGLKVCSGGIVGLGENQQDRICCMSFRLCRFIPNLSRSTCWFQLQVLLGRARAA
jgi:biotin synthase